MARSPVIPQGLGQQAWKGFLKTIQDIQARKLAAESDKEKLDYRRERDLIDDKRWIKRDEDELRRENTGIVKDLFMDYKRSLSQGDYTTAMQKLDLTESERDRLGVIDGRFANEVIDPLRDDITLNATAQQEWKGGLFSSLKWETGDKFDKSYLRAVELDAAGLLSPTNANVLFNLSQQDEEKWNKYDDTNHRSVTGSFLTTSSAFKKTIGWINLPKTEKDFYTNAAMTIQGKTGEQIYRDKNVDASKARDYLAEIRTLAPGLDTAEGFGKFYEGMPKAWQQSWRANISEGLVAENPEISKEGLAKTLCEDWQIDCQNLKPDEEEDDEVEVEDERPVSVIKQEKFLKEIKESKESLRALTDKEEEVLGYSTRRKEISVNANKRGYYTDEEKIELKDLTSKINTEENQKILQSAGRKKTGPVEGSFKMKRVGKRLEKIYRMRVSAENQITKLENLQKVTGGSNKGRYMLGISFISNRERLKRIKDLEAKINDPGTKKAEEYFLRRLRELKGQEGN